MSARSTQFLDHEKQEAFEHSGRPGRKTEHCAPAGTEIIRGRPIPAGEIRHISGLRATDPTE